LKLNAIFIGFFIIIFAAAPSFAALTSEATATVTINSSFTLTLNTNSVNFGSVVPGTWKGNIPDNDGLIITCKTNNGKPWHVYTNLVAPLTNNAKTINSDLIGWGWKGTTATGDFKIPSGTSITVPFIPYLIYDSAASEKNNIPTGSELHLQFGIFVPANQTAGTYTTNIRVTMTE